jgi:hypothetical protein
MEFEMSLRSPIALPSDVPRRGLSKQFPFRVVAIGSLLVAAFSIGLALYANNANGVAGAANPMVVSTAYGTLNNFDCVNDTGVDAHGFEIELEDIRCTDISYTYDYSHYGVPNISEDLSNPLHPRVIVRYASRKNPDGSWAAYTAVPSGPINPTDGHQFTDPSINFGGEHFGVGYNANPTAVRYNWLIDDGTGNLVKGPPVMVSTPTWTYSPPIGGAPANVVAAIVPPPPAPENPPAYQFGDAVWVKSIKTTTHNANKVRLQDLVADDPGFPDPWANGEPDEVEVEWRLMQTKFDDPDGGVNGELQGGAEEMPEGDEVVTRRYEFFKYLGPFDAESNEAMADAVGPDDLHGVGEVTYNHHRDPITGEWVTQTDDLTQIIVVGEFFGAQMAGFDVAPALGLIDNLQDGVVGEIYPDRRIVIAGPLAFTSNVTAGSVPPGMTYDEFSGVLSGTPTTAGAYAFTIAASDGSPANVEHSYTLTVVSGAVGGTYNITTASSPAAGGTTTGGGAFNAGDTATVIATANAGYYFGEWQEADVHFSFNPTYSFTVNASRDLVAKFLSDSQPPTTTVVRSGSAGTNGWYLGPVEVTLSATDALSGVKATYYELDAGTTMLYAAPFTVSTEGAHSLTYWSEDNAQNVEPPNVGSVNIDGTPPVIAATPSRTTLKPANGKMLTVTISGTVTDNASGVLTTSGAYSTLDSYGLIEPSGTFTVGPSGAYSFTIQLEARLVKRATVARTYTVVLTVLDVAGNQATRNVVVTVPTKK